MKFAQLFILFSLVISGVTTIGCGATTLDTTGSTAPVVTEVKPLVLPFEGGAVSLVGTHYQGAYNQGARKVYVFDEVGQARAKAGQPIRPYILAEAGLRENDSFVLTWTARDDGPVRSSGQLVYLVFTDDAGKILFQRDTLDATVSEDPNAEHRRTAAATAREAELVMIREAHTWAGETREAVAGLLERVQRLDTVTGEVVSALTALRAEMEAQHSSQQALNANLLRRVRALEAALAGRQGN